MKTTPNTGKIRITMNINSKIEKIRQYMRKEGLDCYLVYNFESSDRVNQRYLINFSSSLGSVLVSGDRASFLTDSRYIDAAVDEIFDMEVKKIESKQLEETVDQISTMGCKKVGIDKNSVSVGTFDDLTGALDGVDLVPVDGPIPDMRVCKSDEELELHQRAAEIADDTFSYLMDFVEPGMTEREVALESEFFMRNHGAESISFDPIVAAGSNSAVPHARPEEKTIQEGEILLIDMGAKYEGYCSDMTRTVFIGEPTKKMEDIYGIVLEAQKAGLTALGPEVSTKEVDSKAREIIKDHGYGENFGHGLGHGVGLEIHEKPRLAQTEDSELRPGMVVTVEPGIYLPEWGGVRIEDMVRITGDGYEFFSRSPKEKVINPLG